MTGIKAKKVSNYELFYDLVFVLATSTLTAMLHHTEHGIGWGDIIKFVLAIVSVWSLWFTENIYLNKYSERIGYDIYTIILSMLVIGNMMTVLSLDWRSNYLKFIGLLLVAYAIIIVQYCLYAKRFGGFTRDIKAQIASILMVMGILIAAVAVLYFKLMQDEGLVFLVAYAIIVVTPWFFSKNMDHQLINFPHMVERMQLITILTFGEAVIVLIKNYPLFDNAVISFFSFTSLAFVFVAYISQTALTIEHHQQNMPTVLMYAHMGILISVNTLTVGMELMHQPNMANVAIYLILVGVGAFYVCLFATSVYNKAGFETNKQLYLIYGAIYVVGASLILLFGQTHREFVFVILTVMAIAITRVGLFWRRKRLGVQTIEETLITK